MATTITTRTSLTQQFLPFLTQPAGVTLARLVHPWLLCTVSLKPSVHRGRPGHSQQLDIYPASEYDL